ncbi:hypothetical protein GCK72_007917 [Caenorhabditis remanei]|uniref:F-box associated domain-containing protein n=1 Tax=Caenorhabditis remanei TaxID=31234 RepID=A0A6A5HNR6_CAERE|nr:hypothetical protein GCK72_007917 [Caenorhabditis remanei]KAF1767957.1 hypothetical protein GCK72_007917 [Caenorhabditis remanei]
MEQTRSRQLGYDALKSVLKWMSVEKRQDLHNHIPSLRAINSLLPYTIDDVRIWENELSINRTQWAFRKNSEESNSDDDDPNQSTVSIKDLNSDKCSLDFRVNQSPDEAFEKCFNVYLKNGSTIQNLDLLHVPKFLCEREDPDGFKLNISRLEANDWIVDKFDSFIRFVNLDNLDDISLSLCDEEGEKFGMLGKPSLGENSWFIGIINCKNLDLELYASRSLINYYIGLRNQTLVLNQNYFDVNDLRMLIENWKTSDRPIGTCFCLLSYYIDDIFNSLELQDTFPVEIQHDSADTPGIGIKMEDNRDLVLYIGEHQVDEGAFQALKMEVIASGSEKKNGDSEVSAKEADEGEPSEKRARQ